MNLGKIRTVCRLGAAATGLVFVATGCTVDLRIEATPEDGQVPTAHELPPASVTPSEASDEQAASPPAPDEPGVTPDPAVELSLDDTVEFTRIDLERYWTARLPDLYGIAFSPVRGFGGYRPSNVASLPICDGARGPVEEYRDNAFYCPTDDIIAWDAETLFPSIRETYGDFAVALVLAHEYGHAVQSRAGEVASSILLELQADCFAGAWAGALSREAGDPLVVADLDEAIGGYLEFRDPIGTPADDPLAHGSGFDRITAFFDGFANEAEACVDYDTDPPPIADIAFDPADRITGGDLPLPELEPLVLDELATYWKVVIGDTYVRPTEVRFDPATDEPLCGGVAFPTDARVGAAVYCTADNALLWDDRLLLPDLWNQVGDGAAMYVLVNLSAQSALVQLGDDAADPGFALAAECLTGAFNADLYLGNLQQLRISAGDLDETVVGLSLYLPSLPDAIGQSGNTLPERIASLRLGFDEGSAAC